MTTATATTAIPRPKRAKAEETTRRNVYVKYRLIATRMRSGERSELAKTAKSSAYPTKVQMRCSSFLSRLSRRMLLSKGFNGPAVAFEDEILIAA